MDHEWNSHQPIYRQLRDQVIAMILDRVLNEGDPLSGPDFPVVWTRRREQEAA